MFEFVSVDSSGRAIAADRLRIRSRAALDKNKRKDSRRSRKDARRFEALKREAVARASLPSPPPHDLRLVPFAEKIPSESQELLFKVFGLKTLDQGKSPLERCIKFDMWDAACFEWLQQDSAFLQSVLTSAAMVDETHCLARKEQGGRMWFHLQRTITFLNHRLSGENSHLQDSTLNVILTLSLLACSLGDYDALKVHLSGLQRIVHLRGGLRFLRERPMLHFRVNHIDLTWTLMTGERPYFLPDYTSWKPIFPSHRIVPGLEARASLANLVVDDRLIIVFRDMQFAVLLLNQGAKKNTRYTGDTFQPILCSIQSRLLLLADELRDPFSECVRLTMLAFLSSAMNFPAIRFRARYLETHLERMLGSLDGDYNLHDRFALDLWIAMVSWGSVPGFRKEWMPCRFTATVRELASTWQKAKAYLSDVMWIDNIHDSSGEIIFQGFFLDPSGGTSGSTIRH